MHRLAILAALLVAVLVPTAIATTTAGAATTSGPGVRLIALGGHFRLGGGGFGRRRFGGGRVGRRGSSRGILRRIARVLAFAYILHLLFSHGGLSILLWLIVIGLVVHFVRRRRRRRYAY